MKKNKILAYAFFAITAALGYLLIVGTLIPYGQMKFMYHRLRKTVNGDASALSDQSFMFSPKTFVQPELVAGLLDYVVSHSDENKYAAQNVPFVLDKAQQIITPQDPYSEHFLILGKAYDWMANETNDSERANEYRAKAAAAYVHALSLFPGNQRILFAYAIDRADTGDLSTALKLVDQAFTEDSRVTEAHYYRGFIYYLADNEKNANSALNDLEYSLDRMSDPMSGSTRLVYQKLLAHYYSTNDLPRFLIVVKRLARIDVKQGAVYKSIVDYVTATGTMPTLRLSRASS